MTQIEGLGVVESVDKIALTDPKYEDYRGQEISIVLSKVNDPKLLFDYFEEFDKKYRTVSKEEDGKCFPCGRYANALELTMKRLSEINTDESARYLVAILEKGIVSGHAHLSEELLHHIAETGPSSLPYLKGIESSNQLARTAIGCIEKHEPCH